MIDCHLLSRIAQLLSSPKIDATSHNFIDSCYLLESLKRYNALKYLRLRQRCSIVSSESLAILSLGLTRLYVQLAEYIALDNRQSKHIHTYIPYEERLSECRRLDSRVHLDF